MSSSGPAAAGDEALFVEEGEEVGEVAEAAVARSERVAVVGVGKPVDFIFDFFILSFLLWSLV